MSRYIWNSHKVILTFSRYFRTIILWFLQLSLLFPSYNSVKQFYPFQLISRIDQLSRLFVEAAGSNPNHRTDLSESLFFFCFFVFWDWLIIHNICVHWNIYRISEREASEIPLADQANKLNFKNVELRVLQTIDSQQQFHHIYSVCYFDLNSWYIVVINGKWEYDAQKAFRTARQDQRWRTHFGRPVGHGKRG